MRSFSGTYLFSTAILIAAIGFTALALPFARAEQARPPLKVDPQTQRLNYYRQYPERYIRISDESWKIDEISRTASHSFKLTNTAGVAYSNIEIRVSYLNADCKTLQSAVLKIQGVLGPYSKMQVQKMKAKNVSKVSDTALLAVAKATVRP